MLILSLFNDAPAFHAKIYIFNKILPQSKLKVSFLQGTYNLYIEVTNEKTSAICNKSEITV